MGAVWERGAFLDEVVNPREHLRMRKVNVAGFDQRAHRGGSGNLATLGVYRNNAGDVMLKHLDNGRSVGLVLDQLRMAGMPFSGHVADGFHRSGEVCARTELIEQ